jgi:hypothetical protein
MLWCVLHHHGPQAAHHDISSRAFSVLEHRVNFACTTIVHFVLGNVTWFHFECFTSLPWQICHDSSLVEFPFEVLFSPHTPLYVGVFDLAHQASRSPSRAYVKCPH